MADFNYYYGNEADQFTFYRIPKFLFQNEAFKNMTTEAKVLYGLMLDRMSLSRKNGWMDKLNRVYIIYTIEDIMDAIQCGDRKASKLLNELENQYKLIERKRQGLCRPNLIYVKNFVAVRPNDDSGDEGSAGAEECDVHEHAEEKTDQMPDTVNPVRPDEGSETDSAENTGNHAEDESCSADEKDTVHPASCRERRFRTRQNDDSGDARMTDPDLLKSRSNKLNLNETESSKTDPILSNPESRKGRDGIAVNEKEEQIRQCIEDYFREQLGFDILLHDHAEDQRTLNAILNLLVDTCCSKRKTIRIAGDDKSIEVVKSQFMKLNMAHIRYVLQCLNDNTTHVYNMKQYMLAALYNAPLTIDSYYNNLVNRHMAEGRL